MNSSLRLVAFLILCAAGCRFPGADNAEYGLPTVTRRVSPVKFVTNSANRVFVDFGKAAFGYLEVKAPSSSTGGVSRIIMGEMKHPWDSVRLTCGASIMVEESLLNIPSGEMIYRAETPANIRNTDYTLPTPPVRVSDEYGVILPFRYIEVYALPFEPTPGSFTMIAINYPIDMSASAFVSSEKRLDAVYEFCKYTILATSFAGLYVDGNRERIPYESDAYINQLGEYAVHSDTALSKATIEYLLRHGTWPAEWQQHMIKMVWQYWMRTGDADFVREVYGTLKTRKLLLDKIRDEDGLLVVGYESPTVPRAIIDWPETERDGFAFCQVNAVVNAFYYRNLLEMTDLARAIGEKHDACEFEKLAKRVFLSYQRVFFDQDLGLYRDGEGTNHTSIHANAIALAFGLVPEKYSCHVSGWCATRGMACSTYFSQYLLEGLFASGRADEAIALMSSDTDRSWIGMMRQGSTMTMESWNREVKPNLDWNHAWSTAPLNVIVRYLLGVTPLEPGMNKVRIAPQVGGLSTVSGRVPTTRGPVTVKINEGRLEVDTPVPAIVEWRGKSHEIVGRRTFFD